MTVRSALRRLTGGRWPQVSPTEHMSCSEVGRLLQQYLDGELTGEDRLAALTGHLEECRRCGLEADTYRKIKTALERHREPVPPESVARLREFGRRLTEH